MYQQHNKVEVWSNIIWEANGWMHNHPDRYRYFSLADWNQTIVSRINQASADIHRKTMDGGGDILEVSSNVEDILDYLPQYNITNKIFAGRYKIIIKDTTSSMIKVYNQKDKSVCRIIEIIGLSEPFKDEEPVITKNYKYLLIKY